MHPLCPSRSVPTVTTLGDRLCNFSPLGHRMDRVVICEEFLYLAQNGTQLLSLSLDKNSVLMDGKAPSTLGWSVVSNFHTWGPCWESGCLGMGQHLTFSDRQKMT